jgi:hypothetical protein
VRKNIQPEKLDANFWPDVDQRFPRGTPERDKFLAPFRNLAALAETRRYREAVSEAIGRRQEAERLASLPSYE